MKDSLDIVILGLSITSSWGNGHATTYRALVRALVERGHRVLFLERDARWYAENRDLPHPPYGETRLYRSLDELRDRFTAAVRVADVVIVGSYVPQGSAVGAWVTATASGKTAFYDIDTPITLRNVELGTCEYLCAELMPRYDLYLSFTGGPVLRAIESKFGVARARALYCSVDPDVYFPEHRATEWDFGYLATYSTDRQAKLDAMLLGPARAWREGRFCVAGPQYPADIVWPANVSRVEHLAPSEHRAFYGSQRFTLNVTRADMVRAGWSPSVRIFEAAACGTPIVSDAWPGLREFLEPGREILLARSTEQALAILRNTTDDERQGIAMRARKRVLAEHTAASRAAALDRFVRELFEADASRRGKPRTRALSEVT
ncbi:MAG: glycosyltransferase [Myxococcota bacterium]|nr:glycosyltransferase [Myxococcota bacterium]